MTLVRKTLPLLPIDGRELLSAVRENSEDELDLAEGYLHAAQAALFSHVRRAAHYTKFTLTLPCFPSNYSTTQNFDVPFTRHDYASAYTEGIELRVLPFVQVDSIQYYDTDNATQTWATTNYTIIDGGVDRPAVIYPSVAADTWPDTKARPDAVTVTFWAGEVTQATYAAVIAPYVGTDAVQTVDAFAFTANDEITLSHSGNANEILAPVAKGFGTTARKTYYVTQAVTDTFELSDTLAGTPIALDTPVAATAFVGTLSPLVRRVLLSVATDWWMNRCPLEDCSCEVNESGKIAGQMSLLQWSHGMGA